MLYLVRGLKMKEHMYKGYKHSIPFFDELVKLDLKEGKEIKVYKQYCKGHIYYRYVVSAKK